MVGGDGDGEEDGGWIGSENDRMVEQTRESSGYEPGLTGMKRLDILDDSTGNNPKTLEVVKTVLHVNTDTPLD